MEAAGSPGPNKLWLFLVMFLPTVGYSAGEWLIATWPPAQRLDQLIAPYCLNVALAIGLAIGLAQLGWSYFKTREMSSYLVQQLVILLAYTAIPLRVGHQVRGMNIFALIGLGVAVVYLGDAIFGGKLMAAYAERFSSAYRKSTNKGRGTHARTIVIHIELAMVFVFGFRSLYLLLGSSILPKAIYLAILPFATKYIWVAFVLFTLRYPRWAKNRLNGTGALEENREGVELYAGR